MMDHEKIEELLEKYYRGETSLEEENALHRFFEQSEIPGHLKAEAGLFRFFAKEKSGNLPEGLEQKLERTIQSPFLKKQFPLQRMRLVWIGSAAAAVLILAGIFIDLQIRKNTSLVVRKDTYEDPYLAYAEAKKVLYYVSGKMNAGTESLKNIEKLDDGMNYMNPVLSFGTGMQYLDHFSRIEETRKLISKK